MKKRKSQKHTRSYLKAKKEEMSFVNEVDSQPKSFEEEITTVWSFPDRGTWATHK
jgi:hypothetical protein